MHRMNGVKAIRKRIGVSQTVLAQALGCTQGNVSHYERGQTFPPEMAAKLISFAATRGLRVSYDDIYGRPAKAKRRRAPAPA